MQVVKQLLLLYAWLVIGVLLFFLWRIAAFYEEASGHRVGHRFLLVPGVLLAVGVVWYVSHDSSFVGEPVGDLFLFSGGILLAYFGSRLQKLMTGE